MSFLPRPIPSVRLRPVLPILFGLLWTFNATLLPATTQEDPARTSLAATELPEQFGTIVYQTQAASSSRIYIIANGHRSALNGNSHAKTLQAQMETFRIGEWLISQKRIALVLPEGFFGTLGTAGAAGADNRLLDSLTLQTALADATHFVNAELLLHEKYGIGLAQIEDRALYRDVRERLAASRGAGARSTFSLPGELAYLQKLRTANLLQAAPAVVATAYQEGRIAAPNAMLTIGLAHLHDIIAFLEAGEIAMAGLHTADLAFPPRSNELELLKQRVGVTVIVPRALMSEGLPVQKSS